MKFVRYVSIDSGNGEDCGVVKDSGFFADAGCGTRLPFVCEVPPEEVEYTCHMDQEWHAAPRQEYSAHTCYCKQLCTELKEELIKLPVLQGTGASTRRRR